MLLLGMILFAGCNESKSSKKLNVDKKIITAFLKNNIPSFVELKDVSLDEVEAPLKGGWNIKAKAWLVKFKATYVIKENLYSNIIFPKKNRYYSKNNDKEAESLLQPFIEKNNKLSGLFEWEEKILASKLKKYYLTSQKDPESRLKRFNMPKFLKLTYKKNEEHTVYGKIFAVKMLDTWDLALQSKNFPYFGNTLSSFGKGYVIVNSKDADKVMQELKANIAIANARRIEVENIIAERKKEMEEQLKTGSVYSGTNKKGQKATLKIHKLFPQDMTFTATLTYPNGSTKGYKKSVKKIRGSYDIYTSKKNGNVSWWCGHSFLKNNEFYITEDGTYSTLSLKRVK